MEASNKILNIEPVYPLDGFNIYIILEIQPEGVLDMKEEPKNEKN